MIKKLFLLSLVIAMAATVKAQVERNVIYRCARGNMTYTEPVKKKDSAAKSVGKILGSVLQAAAGSASSTTDYPEYADAVKDAIMGAVGSARRIRVVDGSFLPDELAEGETALYCDASISTISCTTRVRTWEDKDKKKHEETEYRGNIVGTINIKDVRTDEIVVSRTINSSSWSSSWLETPAKALGYTISNMKSHICSMLNDAFPLYASIVEGSRATEKKSKEVYIDLGETMGCSTGMHFNVYTVKTVAGKEAKKQVGQLKVTEVMGDDISLCKVQRGGVEIKAAIESGEKLLITSKD